MRFAAVVIVTLFALAGCPSSAPKDPAYTPAGPKPCEGMADHLVGLMQPTDPETGKPIDPHPETVDKITQVLIKICTDDKWTEDAQRCFTKLAAIKDAGTCASLLTVEQRDRADQAMAAALGPPPKAEPKADPGGGSDSAPE